MAKVSNSRLSGLVAVQLLSYIWPFVTPWTAACQASLSWMPWAVSGFEPSQFLFLLVWPWTRNSATMIFHFLIRKTDNIPYSTMGLRIKWTQVYKKCLAPWLTQEGLNEWSFCFFVFVLFNHKHKMEYIGKNVPKSVFHKLCLAE